MNKDIKSLIIIQIKILLYHENFNENEKDQTKISKIYQSYANIYLNTWENI